MTGNPINKADTREDVWHLFKNKQIISGKSLTISSVDIILKVEISILDNCCISYRKSGGDKDERTDTRRNNT